MSFSPNLHFSPLAFALVRINHMLELNFYVHVNSFKAKLYKAFEHAGPQFRLKEAMLALQLLKNVLLPPFHIRQ